MRAEITIAIYMLAAGCAGPGHDALARTPVATTPARAVESPAASTSDRDREHAVQQMDDIRDAKQAHHEAGTLKEPVPTPIPTATSATAPTPPPGVVLPGAAPAHP